MSSELSVFMLLFCVSCSALMTHVVSELLPRLRVCFVGPFPVLCTGNKAACEWWIHGKIHSTLNLIPQGNISVCMVHVLSYCTCNMTQWPFSAAKSRACSATTSWPWPRETLWKFLLSNVKPSFFPERKHTRNISKTMLSTCLKQKSDILETFLPLSYWE